LLNHPVLITVPNLDEMDGIYRSGQALANPRQLREALNHLRDVMFEKLRDSEGREKDDRKGPDPIHHAKR